MLCCSVNNLVTYEHLPLSAFLGAFFIYLLDRIVKIGQETRDLEKGGGHAVKGPQVGF